MFLFAIMDRGFVSDAEHVRGTVSEAEHLSIPALFTTDMDTLAIDLMRFDDEDERGLGRVAAVIYQDSINIVAFHHISRPSVCWLIT